MKNKQLYWRHISSCSFFLVMYILWSCSSGSSTVHEMELQEDSTILKAIYVRPLRDVKFKSTPERIARGKYLTEGPLWCFNCHTERDTTKSGWPPRLEKKGSGSIVWKTDSTHLYAPNITSHKTGIGSFTDDMIARAIREGVGYDGRALQAMPWASFRELSDEDVASVVCYLRTIPAIDNKVPRRKLGKKRELASREGAYPLTREADVPDMGVPLQRGKYLIGLADCIGCHTGWYKRNPGAFAGGNPMDHNEQHIFSSNITSDSTGVGAWSVETFVYVMKNGKGKGGALHSKMPWVSYRNMTDEDLEAIYHALMTTYPIKHIVHNGVELSHCEVCDFDHGLGNQNKIEPIKAYKNAAVPLDVVGSYIGELFPDTLIVRLSENTIVLNQFGEEWKLIPINTTQYMAEGMLAPLQFIRDANGNVIELQFSDLGRNFKKQSLQ